MASFDSEIPNELIKQFELLDNNSEKMIGEMTRSGAEKVYKNIHINMNKSFKSTVSLEKGLKITRTYKTKSDDGINTKVGFFGYDVDGIPIPLKAKAREYGTSRGEKRKPFFRKSFNKSEIEAEMLKVQEKYLPKE